MVGTVGGGYSAHTALAAATQPGVAAVVVEDEPGLDVYTGWPGTRGRLLLAHPTAWLSFVQSGIWTDSQAWVDLLNFVPLAEVGELLPEGEPPFLLDFLDHFAAPEDDPWRQLHSLTPHLDELCAPVLHIRSQPWPYDGVVDNYQTMQEACDGKGGDQYLLLGSKQGMGWFRGWEDGPDKEVDAAVDDFLAAYLNGATQGPEHTVAYRDQATGKWSGTDSPTGPGEKVYHLKALGEWGGTLSTQPPGEAVWTGLPNIPEEQVDPCSESVHTLYFETDALDEDMTILGAHNYSFQVKSSTPDGDLVAVVYERTPGDEYVIIALGGSRLSYRDSGKHTGPMPQGLGVTVSGELTAKPHTITAGSKLALIVSPQGCWYHENANSGEPVGFESGQVAGMLELGTGGKGSTLTIPVVAD